MGKTTQVTTSNVELLSIAFDANKTFKDKKILEIVPTMHNENGDFKGTPRYYGIIKAGYNLEFALQKLQWKLENNTRDNNTTYSFYNLKKAIEELVDAGVLTAEIK